MLRKKIFKHEQLEYNKNRLVQWLHYRESKSSDAAKTLENIIKACQLLHEVHTLASIDSKKFPLEEKQFPQFNPSNINLETIQIPNQFLALLNKIKKFKKKT